MSRLGFEERSLYRHSLPEPTAEELEKAEKDSNPKDKWFGYTRQEVALKTLIDQLTQFRNLYITANSDKNTKAPEFVEYPSPYNDKQRMKPNFSEEEVQTAMERQAMAMAMVVDIKDGASFFAGGEETSESEPPDSKEKGLE